MATRKIRKSIRGALAVPTAARRTATQRQARHSLWVYGIHAAGAALQNPARRCHRFVATSAAVAPDAGHWRPEIIDRDTMAALLPGGAVHQGLAVLVDPLPAVDLAAVCAHGGDDSVVVVLDQLTDPHNVGAIIRSAAALGAQAVIAPERHTPPITGVLAKAAAGGLERLPLVKVGNLAMALDELKRAGFWCLGLDPAGEISITEAPTNGRRALILGAEGQGLRRRTRDCCDHLVRIPMAADAESLNVSNAAAVALYALVRHR